MMMMMMVVVMMLVISHFFVPNKSFVAFFTKRLGKFLEFWELINFED